MDSEILANKARNSISDYCMNTCKAYCCRKGFLELSKKEMLLVTNDKRKYLEENNALVEIEGGSFVLTLGNPINCPSLKDLKCIIHKNEERPSACKKFPIFLEKNTIRISDRCPALKDGLFYSYIHQFLELGFKLV